MTHHTATNDSPYSTSLPWMKPQSGCVINHHYSI